MHTQKQTHSPYLEVCCFIVKWDKIYTKLTFDKTLFQFQIIDIFLISPRKHDEVIIRSASGEALLMIT